MITNICAKSNVLLMLLAMASCSKDPTPNSIAVVSSNQSILGSTEDLCEDDKVVCHFVGGRLVTLADNTKVLSARAEYYYSPGTYTDSNISSVSSFIQTSENDYWEAMTLVAYQGAFWWSYIHYYRYPEAVKLQVCNHSGDPLASDPILFTARIE